MRWIRIYILVFVIVLLIAINFMILYYSYSESKSYYDVLYRTRNILRLQSLYEDIYKELWGIVSVYDPTKFKKVNFEEGRQYELLKEMRGYIREAKGMSENPGMELKREIIERTVDSLARQIDKLKEKTALQEFDTRNTSIFFSARKKSRVLSDSYVDEMELLMENIKIIGGLLDQSVQEYTQKVVGMLAEINQRILDKKRVLIIANFSIIIALAIVLLITVPIILLRG